MHYEYAPTHPKPNACIHMHIHSYVLSVFTHTPIDTHAYTYIYAMHISIPDIPKGNIIELNELIYAQAELVFDKIRFSPKEFEQKYQTWIGNLARRTGINIATTSKIAKERKKRKSIGMKRQNKTGDKSDNLKR